MSNEPGQREYDLEDRTFQFAKNVRAMVKHLPRTLANVEDARQLIRSSGSVGANYIEANEALSKKDFRMRIKISRKESKESAYWLRLLDTRSDQTVGQERDNMVKESRELMHIFGAILQKTQ